jgi:hypothetical protein
MRTWVLKVALNWNRRVWRTVELRGDQSLHDVHEIIQDAFDWDNDHLYAFYMTNKAGDQRNAYGGPYTEMPSAMEIRLDRLGLHPSQKFLYIFDFGDDLRHQITVVGQGTYDASAQYPRILQTRGEAPAQYGDPEEY